MSTFAKSLRATRLPFHRAPPSPERRITKGARKPGRQYRKRTYDCFEHPAQKIYACACDDAGKRRVAPDAVLLETLAFGVIFVDLPRFTIDATRALARLILQAKECMVHSVYLNCGIDAKKKREYYGAQTVFQPLTRRHKKAMANSSEKFTIILRALSTAVSMEESHITRLEISGIKMDAKLTSLLSCALKAPHSRLHTFSISDAVVGDASAAALCDAISSSNISNLTLRSCELTDASAKPLVEMLRQHSSRRCALRWANSLRKDEDENSVQLQGVVSIDVSRNQLGDRFARLLAKLLETDEWLRAINVSFNQISSNGVDEFCSCILDRNETLAILDLRANDGQSQYSVVALDEVLARRNAMKGGLLYQQDSDVTSVVSSSIVKWRSGHQLFPDTAERVAALTETTSTFSPEDMVGEDSDRDENALDMLQSQALQLSLSLEVDKSTEEAESSESIKELFSLPFRKSPKPQTLPNVSAKESEAELMMREMRKAIHDAIETSAIPTDKKAAVAALVSETMPEHILAPASDSRTDHDTVDDAGESMCISGTRPEEDTMVNHLASVLENINASLDDSEAILNKL